MSTRIRLIGQDAAADQGHDQHQGRDRVAAWRRRSDSWPSLPASSRQIRLRQKKRRVRVGQAPERKEFRSCSIPLCSRADGPTHRSQGPRKRPDFGGRRRPVVRADPAKNREGNPVDLGDFVPSNALGSSPSGHAIASLLPSSFTPPWSLDPAWSRIAMIARRNGHGPRD